MYNKISNMRNDRDFASFLIFTILIFCQSSLISKAFAKNVTEASHISDKSWCDQIKSKFAIVPGKSFGNLPSKMHPEYLNKRCYRFFCEPNLRAGKGLFDCIPLSSGEATINEPAELAPLLTE